MATMNKYTFNASDSIAAVTLTGTDDVTLNASKTSVLIVENFGVGEVTINLLGDLVDSTDCSGVGEIDLSGGLDVPVAAGERLKFQLHPFHSAWLGTGLVNITGGTADLTAYVVEA